MFTALTALYRCFYDKALWVDVAQRWRGGAIGFLLLVALLTTGFATTSGFVIWQGLSRTAVTDILEQMPERFSLTLDDDGQLSTSLQQPFEIKFPKELSGSTDDEDKESLPSLILLDTNETLQSIQGSSRARTALIYIVRDGVYAHDRNKASSRIFNFAEIMKNSESRAKDGAEARRLKATTYTLTREQIGAGVNSMIVWFLVIILPVFVVISLLFKMPILAALFMLVGIVMARMMKMEIEGTPLWRVAVVALAPATILEVVIQFVGAMTLDPDAAMRLRSFPIFALFTGLYLYSMLREIRAQAGLNSNRPSP